MDGHSLCVVLGPLSWLAPLTHLIKLDVCPSEGPTWSTQLPPVQIRGNDGTSTILQTHIVRQHEAVCYQVQNYIRPVTRINIALYYKRGATDRIIPRNHLVCSCVLV